MTDQQPDTAADSNQKTSSSRIRIIALLILLVVLGIASLWYNRHVKAQQVMAARDLLSDAQSQDLTPDERWQTLQQAISMLRDQLIQERPEQANLYLELARVYQAQLAGGPQQLQLYFVSRHAVEMIMVAGSVKPISWQEYATVPATPEELHSELGAEKMATLTSVLAEAESSLELVEGAFRQEGRVAEELVAPLQEVELLMPLDAYLRKRWLLDLELQPEYVLALQEEVGNLDFRLPMTHALYWAWRGLQQTPEQEEVQEDLQQLRFRALQTLLSEGRLYYLAGNGMPIIGSNLAVAPALRQAFEQRLQERPDSHVIKASYSQFLQTTTVTFFMEGQPEQAAEYLALQRELEPPPEDQEPPSLPQVVLQALGLDQPLNEEEQRSAVASLLSQSYMLLALDRVEAAEMLLWAAASASRQAGEPLPEPGNVKVKDVVEEELRWQVLASVSLSLPQPLVQNLVNRLELNVETLRQYQQRMIDRAEAMQRQQQGQFPMPPSQATPANPSDALTPTLPDTNGGD